MSATLRLVLFWSVLTMFLTPIFFSFFSSCFSLLSGVVSLLVKNAEIFFCLLTFSHARHRKAIVYYCTIGLHFFLLTLCFYRYTILLYMELYVKANPQAPSVSHTLFLISGIGFSLMLILLAFSVAQNRTSWFGRAQTPSGTGLFSRENSYLFASPITALADGTSLIRVTAFILSPQGLGVAGQKVDIRVSGPVNLSSVQPITDTFGRATFDVAATSPGAYTIHAEVAGVAVPQTVSVSFQ